MQAVASQKAVAAMKSARALVRQLVVFMGVTSLCLAELLELLVALQGWMIVNKFVAVMTNVSLWERSGRF